VQNVSYVQKGFPWFEMNHLILLSSWCGFSHTFFPKEDLYLLSTLMWLAKEKSQTQVLTLAFFGLRAFVPTDWIL